MGRMVSHSSRRLDTWTMLVRGRESGFVQRVRLQRGIERLKKMRRVRRVRGARALVCMCCTCFVT